MTDEFSKIMYIHWSVFMKTKLYADSKNNEFIVFLRERVFDQDSNLRPSLK